VLTLFISVLFGGALIVANVFIVSDVFAQTEETEDCGEEALDPEDLWGCMFSADPTFVESGQSTTLAWQCPAGSAVEIDSFEFYMGEGAASGSEEVEMYDDDTFYLTCIPGEVAALVEGVVGSYYIPFYDDEVYDASMIINGSYLYAAITSYDSFYEEYSSFVAIVDAFDPENLTLASVYDLGTFYPYKFRVSDNYLYTLLVDEYGGDARIEIVDVADPTDPTFLTLYQPEYDIWEFDVSDGLMYLMPDWYSAPAVVNVLDVSNPANPQKKGELKIPGFSSYLHPLYEHHILGVGQEGSQVKLSLFDVTNPENPQEVSKYLLDEYWTEVQNNHHAFLQDSDNGVFFMPGGQGGYIFKYANSQLSLQRAVSDLSVKRAVYLDNYLYIIGDTKVAAFINHKVF